MADDLQTHRRIHLWLLGAVCLIAFLLRSEGIHWPKLHPDEYPIGGWIQRTADHWYIADKVYAGGFFTLARPVQWVCRAVYHAGQVFAYHQGITDRIHDEDFDGILFARWFNVWLGTLTCLFLFGLTRRLTGSGGAGVLTALLFAFAQYPVEHSHYGETDTAMVLTLAIALWLCVIAIEPPTPKWLRSTLRSKATAEDGPSFARHSGLLAPPERYAKASREGGRPSHRHAFWFLAAALASGFAAGTKFPLMILLPVVLVLALARTGLPVRRGGQAGWPLSWRGLVRGLGYAALGAGLFALGFILANPMTVMDWHGFWSGLAWEKRRVYQETALNLGLRGSDPHIKCLHHIRLLLDALRTLGWGWIALAVAGLPCVFTKTYRRYWPVLLLFPALYTWYWIFIAPWVRTQEFMNYLPVLAALAVIPLVAMWRLARAGQGSGPFLLRLAAMVMACVALGTNAWNGLCTASLFGWNDTRILARQWQEYHMPDNAVLAVESYAEAACPETLHPPVQLRKIERDGLPYLTAHGADYVLRAASVWGRGVTHPLTDQRYPEPQRSFDEFLGHSERLCAWGPLPPHDLATFISPTIELYGLTPFTPKQPLTLEVSQPLFLSNFDQDEIGRPTFFPIGHKLGSATGLLIDCRPRTIAIGGPTALREPIYGAFSAIYLILNTQERGATIHIRGFGRNRTVTLSPYDMAIVPLIRSRWHLPGMPFEKISLSAAREKDIMYLPCYTRVAFSLAEAGRLCSDLGCEAAFWTCFTDGDFQQMPDPIQRYQLAVRAGRWDLADRFETSAEKAGAALKQPIHADPATVRLNGNSGYYYNALAGVRLQESRISVLRRDEFSRERLRKTTMEDLVTLELPMETMTPLAVCEGALTLPIRVARGHYELKGDLLVIPEPSRQPSATVIEYSLNPREKWMGCYASNMPAGWTPFTVGFSVDTEIQPRIMIRSETPARLYFKNLELRWSLASMLDSTHRTLMKARATHALHRGRHAEALHLLNQLESEGQYANDLELRQLKFQALLGLPDRASPLLAEAANNVLALAPDDYSCLTVLADKDPAIKSKADGLSGNLKKPVACGPFLSLVGCSFDAGRREIACVFEVLKNETPPLAVSFWIRRHGEWRKRQSEPLSGAFSAMSPRPWLNRGERVARTIKLNDRFGPRCEAGGIALGIETAVEWHPGKIPIANRRDFVIPLSEILP